MLLSVCALSSGCGDVLATETLSIALAVQSMTPRSSPISGGTEINLFGRNLQSDLIVEVEGAPAAGVVSDSDQHVTFIAPAAPIGSKSVVLVGRSQKLRLSESLSYYAPNIAFSRRNIALDGYMIEQIATGDITGDGLDDVVARGRRWVSTDGALTLLAFRNESGGLALQPVAESPNAPPESTSGAYPVPLLLGDLNGDSLDDLVRGTTVMLAAGDGRFAPPMTVLCDDEHLERPMSAVVADFDGDGVRSLALLCPSGLVLATVSATGTVSVEPKRVDVRPWFWDDFDSPLLRYPPARAADLNDDGAEELIYFADDRRLHAVTLRDPDDEVVWISETFWGHKPTTMSFSVHDADGDGFEDVIAARRQDLLIHRGSAAGSEFALSEVEERGFVCPSYNFPHVLPTDTTMIEGAAQPTLVLCPQIPMMFYRAEGGLHVLAPLDSGGYLIETASYPAHQGFNDIMAMANLDGDAYADLVVTDRLSIVARMGASNGGVASAETRQFVSHASFAFAPSGMPHAAVGHIAGRPQLVASAGRDVVVASWQGDDIEVTGHHVLADETGASYGIGACDFDADGDDDLVILDGVPREDEEGTYDTAVQFLQIHADASIHPIERALLGVVEDVRELTLRTALNEQLQLGDVNDDGRCDVVVLWDDDDASYARIWLSTESGSFAGSEPLELTNSTASLRPVDLENDGDHDLYEAMPDDGYAPTLWLSDGHGGFIRESFAETLTPLALGAPVHIEALALIPRGDGRLDLWALGNAEGERWVSTAVYQYGESLDDIRHGYVVDSDKLRSQDVEEILWGDFNGDDTADALFVFSLGDALVAVSVADERAPRVTAVEVPTWFPSHRTADFFVADVDLDGRDDIAFATDLQPAKVSYIRNESY